METGNESNCPSLHFPSHAAWRTITITMMKGQGAAGENTSGIGSLRAWQDILKLI